MQSWQHSSALLEDGELREAASLVPQGQPLLCSFAGQAGRAGKGVSFGRGRDPSLKMLTQPPAPVCPAQKMWFGKLSRSLRIFRSCCEQRKRTSMTGKVWVPEKFQSLWENEQDSSGVFRSTATTPCVNTGDADFTPTKHVGLWRFLVHWI